LRGCRSFLFGTMCNGALSVRTAVTAARKTEVGLIHQQKQLGDSFADLRSPMPVLLGRTCLTSARVADLKPDEPAKIAHLAAFLPDEPAKIALRSPPGLPSACPLLAAMAAQRLAGVAPAPRVDPGTPPGLVKGEVALPVLTEAETEAAPVQSEVNAVAGLQVERMADGALNVVWRISNVSNKLRHSRGYPLLSGNFALPGVPEARLLFAPGDEWLELSGATSRAQKRRQARQTGGDDVRTTFGAVKVKAATVLPEQAQGALRCRVFLDGAEVGSGAECDFAERLVQSCDLKKDWRQFLGGSSDCLCVRMEFTPVAQQ